MIINLRLFSEIFGECPTCLLRSLLSGLSRSLTNPSLAQLLVSSFSPQPWRSYSTLGFEEFHLEHVESMDRPRVLREFSLSLYPFPLGSFSLKPWSANSRPFVIPNLTFCLLSLRKTEVVYILLLHPSLPGLKGALYRKPELMWGLPHICSFSQRSKPHNSSWQVPGNHCLICTVLP